MTQKANTKILNEEAESLSAEEIVRRGLKRRMQDSTKSDRKGKRKKIEKKQLAAIERMQKSIETIKRLMVGFSVFVVLTLAVICWAVMETRREVVAIEEKATRIEADVAKIDGKIETVESSIVQPIEKLGRMIGETFDEKLESIANGSFDSSNE